MGDFDLGVSEEQNVVRCVAISCCINGNRNYGKCDSSPFETFWFPIDDRYHMHACINDSFILAGGPPSLKTF